MEEEFEYYMTEMFNFLIIDKEDFTPTKDLGLDSVLYEMYNFFLYDLVASPIPEYFFGYHSRTLIRMT